MKQRFKLSLIFLSCAMTLASCSKAQQTKENEEVNLDDVISEVNKRRGADPDASGGNKCLLSYAGKMDELLTLELAGKLIGFSPEKAKTQYSKVMKNTDYHSLSYSWKNGRIGEISILGGKPLKTEMPDVVVLENLKAISMTQFRKSYRPPTDEEINQMKQVTKDVREGKVQNEEARQAQNKLDKMGVDKKTVGAASEKMEGLFTKAAKAYSDVTGIGDAASWNSFESKLYVLSNGVQFCVRVDIGDEAKEKEKALIIAREILNKCK